MIYREVVSKNELSLKLNICGPKVHKVTQNAGSFGKHKFSHLQTKCCLKVLQPIYFYSINHVVCKVVRSLREYAFNSKL